MYKSRSILTSLTDTVHFHLFKNNLNTDLLTPPLNLLSHSVFFLWAFSAEVFGSGKSVQVGVYAPLSRKSVSHSECVCGMRITVKALDCICVWRRGGTLIQKKKRITLRCILTPSSFRPSFHTRCHGDKIKLTLFWAYRRRRTIWTKLPDENSCTHTLVRTFHTIPDKLTPMAKGTL